jgi:hypothetical protein
MHPLIESNRETIAALCRQYGVRRLEAFGSILRDDFDTHSSDVDLVVEFAPASTGGGFRQYFDLKSKLEALFGRRVDLVELSAMESTRLKRIIERSKVPVYATAA